MKTIHLAINSKSRILMSFFLGFCCIFYATTDLYAEEYTITQLTNNLDYDRSPQIHNGQVVWQGYYGQDSEIFFYDGTQTVQLTDNWFSDGYPQIHNGQIAWMGKPWSQKIFFYDGTQTMQLQANSSYDLIPQIHNGQIVWTGYDYNDYEIYFYDGTQTIQLTDNGISDDSPQINNGQIVWIGNDGNDYEIFFYDGTQTVQLTDNNYYDYGPQIHNGQVVWYGASAWNQDSEIFFYDGTQIVQLTNNNINDVSPQIDNGQIVWRGYDGNDYEIFFYDGTQTIQLTDNNYYDDNPQIHNGQVVWEMFDGDYDICLARPIATRFNLIEKTFTNNTLTETILTQKIILGDVQVSGDLNGPLSFSEFEIVKITTGSFANKGFFNAQWQAELDQKIYNGTYQGVVYLDPQETGVVHLEGSISGDLNGICEDTLTETEPGSGIYDAYQATWKLNLIQETHASATLNLDDTITYGNYSTFISNIYLYQAYMEGDAYGYYAGPLNAVLTHLRLVTLGEYENKGFSMISYTTNYGSGEAQVYNSSSLPDIEEFEGLFKEPLIGTLFASLDEEAAPKTLIGKIVSVNLGLYKPNLKVSVISQRNVSPGETFNYVIEYRNDGFVAASDVVVIDNLDYLVEFISASEGAYYDPYSHQVSWGLGAVPPKSGGRLSIQVKLPWGLQDAIFENRASILDIIFHSEEINGSGTGICINTEDINGMKPFVALAKLNEAEQIIVFDKTNIISGPLEVYLASKDMRTLRNGVGEDAGDGNPIFTGHRPVWMGYSGSTASIVNQAKKGRLSGDVLYLISPQLVTQEDLRLIKSQFNKIVVYQGDDLMPDGIALDLYLWFKSKGDNQFSRDELILLAQEGDMPDPHIEDLLNRMKSSEGKDFDYLEVFSNDPGNRIKITWTDGAVSDFRITDFISSEDNIEVMAASEMKHGDWNKVLLLFMDEYEKMPTNEDNAEFTKIVKEFNKGKLDKRLHQITTARDPNEKFVSPEGKIVSGDLLTYTITYENEGEGIAYGVYITDTLDEDLNVETLVINGGIGKFDSETRTITWLVGEVWPHGEGSFAFQIEAKDNLPENTEIINYATVYFPSVPEVTSTNAVVNIANVTIADGIPPVTQIDISPPANENGWRNSDTIITLTALDNEGGPGVKEIYYSLTGAVIEEQTVQGDSLQLLITNEGITTFSYYAIDNEGNAEPANQVELRLDKTPPVLTMPNLDSIYIYNSAVSFDFSVSDSLSGIVSSAATFNGIPITSGDAVELNILGANTFSLEATDSAGNTESQSITFNVEYNFSGFLPPVEADGSGVYKQRRTLPIKFQLQDVNQVYVSTALATLTLQQFSDETSIGDPIEVESTSGADTGNMFRYDSAEEQYIFNLNTKNLSPGTWQLQVHLNDGTTKIGIIKLK
ncbi:MAG: PxKF domain-containing protein [Candidatus Omnitrophota bacterium]